MQCAKFLLVDYLYITLGVLLILCQGPFMLCYHVNGYYFSIYILTAHHFYLVNSNIMQHSSTLSPLLVIHKPEYLLNQLNPEEPWVKSNHIF